jgi:SAM-dependent methyltransferase
MNRSYEKEMMDLPGHPDELLVEDLRNLRILNRYLGGSRNAIRGLRKELQANGIGRFSLLDVGTGSGDIAASMLIWAKEKGVGARIVGLEANPVTVKTAAILTKPFSEMTVVRGDAAAPPFARASFDFVFASQLLHHFSEEKIVWLLRNWSTVARRAIIISDLLRHPLAYYGIRLLTRLFTRNAMTLTDAPLSVKRAFTLAEWGELFRRADVGPYQLSTVFPFRVMALISLKG